MTNTAHTMEDAPLGVERTNPSISDSICERNAHRAHIEAVADDMGCHYRARSSTLYMVKGLFDLYYFTNEAAAALFARRFGGVVLDTTKGSIWRVSIKL